MEISTGKRAFRAEKKIGKSDFAPPEKYCSYASVRVRGWATYIIIVGFFYSGQFIKSFRSLHSFWEEEDLSREINTNFTEWHRYHIMGIQFQGHPANSTVEYL